MKCATYRFTFVVQLLWQQIASFELIAIFFYLLKS